MAIGQEYKNLLANIKKEYKVGVKLSQRVILRQIREESIQILADATPAEAVKSEWIGEVRGATATVDIWHRKSSSEGRKIYVALLLGARRQGWKINSRDGRNRLRWPARPYSTGPYRAMGGGGVGFFSVIHRRRPHRGQSGWIHRNFIGIERKLQRRANEILMSFGIADPVVRVRLKRGE